jgi:hypothetical protein
VVKTCTNASAVKLRLLEASSHTFLHVQTGTGKTMLAKAVANATNATFISMVGSEFVQKYLGEVSGRLQCAARRDDAGPCDMMQRESNTNILSIHFVTRVRVWSVMSFDWRERTRLASSLSTRLMRLPPSALMRRPAPTRRCNGKSGWLRDVTSTAPFSCLTHTDCLAVQYSSRAVEPDGRL